MANIISLKLLPNKNIIAEMNDIPLGNANSYRIIAGEKNSTAFEIKSKPSQYENAVYYVDMVNSKGEKVLSSIIENNAFKLPNEMAVAGYGTISIRCATIQDELVVWNPLKIKIWNTIASSITPPPKPTETFMQNVRVDGATGLLTKEYSDGSIVADDGIQKYVETNIENALMRDY